MQCVHTNIEHLELLHLTEVQRRLILLLLVPHKFPPHSIESQQPPNWLVLWVHLCIGDPMEVEYTMEWHKVSLDCWLLHRDLEALSTQEGGRCHFHIRTIGGLGEQEKNHQDKSNCVQLRSLDTRLLRMGFENEPQCCYKCCGSHHHLAVVLLVEDVVALPLQEEGDVGQKRRKPKGEKGEEWASWMRLFEWKWKTKKKNRKQKQKEKTKIGRRMKNKNQERKKTHTKRQKRFFGSFLIKNKKS